MDGQLLIHLDRLSDKATLFEGVVRPGDLENLADELASPDGELRYRITARLDGARRRVVSCIIEGFVFLTCQSTIDAFRHEVAIDDRLVLVDSEEELPPFEEEGDREDFVVATEPVDVLGLVEEAVILCPAHGPAEARAGAGCRRPATASRASRRRSRRWRG